MKKIYLTGLESSGQTWIRKCLNQHPDLDVIGDSAPTGWGRYKERRYDCAPLDCDAFVIVTRDQTCHRLSVDKLGYNRGCEGQFTDEESKAHILNYASQASNVLWISYEAVMCYGQDYFDWVFRQLGVTPIHIETEYRDGNLKYIK